MEVEDEALEDDANCAVVVPDRGHGGALVGDEGVAAILG